MKPVIGVSLKTYMGPAKTAEYLDKLQPVFSLCKDLDVDLFVAPDMVSLGRTTLPPHVWLAAQDCHWDDGAYTGTASPRNLKELGVAVVEIGHAERRRLFGESDHDVAKKVEAAVRNQMIPLVCVGEQANDVDAGISTCTQQIEAFIDKVPATSPVIIAYEPVWAIGQPKPAEPDYIRAVARGIRATLDKHGRQDVRIIYGGSAGVGLFGQLVPELDGLFLGRFGHDPANVLTVIKEAREAKS